MSRHQSRVCAVQILYALNVQSVAQIPTELEVRKAILGFWNTFEEAVTDKAYSDQLVKGASTYRSEVDLMIREASAHWRLERMATIDLTILRLAAYELLFEPDLAKQVIINESVELAKEFSSPEAASFINGVLAGILKQIPARAAALKPTLPDSTPGTES